jgi:precorrin-6B methylase 2
MKLFLFLVVIYLLSISIIRGAPYVPTHKRQIEIALDLLKLKKGDHLVDVGSGDGSVLIAAAKRGIRATGYEINPLVYLVSKIRTYKYRKLVNIKLADMWRQKFPEDMDALFIFQMGKYIPRFAEKIRKEKLGKVKLVTYGFELPDHKVHSEKEGMRRYDIS